MAEDFILGKMKRTNESWWISSCQDVAVAKKNPMFLQPWVYKQRNHKEDRSYISSGVATGC